ncbi:two-component system sporulation sensor kinase B [Tumebacillus permanentifrigoris]|uniref:histidine kinase n=1 Tax=Tumebacillus permanentifrigoris TaxID=378543 RepID=A0A316D7H2_9BACL|nr:two-component system sporulation sensor kinase B [Tumebacillus permanentifrigoris]
MTGEQKTGIILYVQIKKMEELLLSRDLLLNLLLILTPIFVYQVLLLDRLSSKRPRLEQWLLGLLYGIACVLCMVFPITAGKDFLWDLRWVPFIISVLYGGWRSGVLAMLLLLGFRLYIGGGLAFYMTVIIAVSAFAGTLWIRKRYMAYNRTQKVFCSLGLTMATFLVMMALIWYVFDARSDVSFLIGQGSCFYSAYAGVYVFSMAFSVLLIENLMESARMREEIRKSEKLSIISELAASIAHEIRTPLTVVRGFIQLAQSSMAETNQSYMATAIAELDRAEFIISDYLNFAKPELDHLERVNVGEEVRNMANFMTSFATMQGVELVTDVQETLYVFADKVKLKQVIINLVKNSIEAIRHGGRVEVQARRSGDRVLITVTDTGEGMTSVQLERLGKPFYSTKDKGIGLGLMVTFRIVEAMQGTLTFESQKGRGTKATISVNAVAMHKEET